VSAKRITLKLADKAVRAPQVVMKITRDA